MKTAAYAAFSATTPLRPFTFNRREIGSCDVHIEILYCGVCHSDIHSVRNEWKGSVYPIVPGHEIVGKVKCVGPSVKQFRPGDFAMVGCLVDACRSCSSCAEGLEQYCEKGMVLTYNSPDPHQTEPMTYGGYSTQIIVDEKFTLRVPKQFTQQQLPAIAPLVCAGITTYSPLRHWKIRKGMRVGVVGLGGLGHMGIKLARAMGAEVVLFTTSTHKIADGKRLGAHHVVLSNKKEEMLPFTGTCDFILNTVSVPHQLDLYIDLLKRDGTLCLVGLPEKLHPSFPVGGLIFKRRAVAGSVIGGIKETQEMLDFCAEHGITSDIELIPIDQINQAYERMLRNDVKYRFVIDMSSL